MIKEYCDSCGVELTKFSHRVVFTYRELGVDVDDSIRRKVVCIDCWRKILDVMELKEDDPPEEGEGRLSIEDDLPKDYPTIEDLQNDGRFEVFKDGTDTWYIPKDGKLDR